MIYGWKITDGSIKASGPKGSIVRFNLANYEPTKITQIILFDTNSTPPTSKVVNGAIYLATLYGYPGSSGTVPNAAYCLTENDLDVFVDDAIFDSADNKIMIAIFWECNAKNGVNGTDTVDAPQEAGTLLKNVILRLTYEDKNRPVPQQVIQGIREERASLGI
jgi:hypothetical protein